jgi:hypothetical protein
MLALLINFVNAAFQALQDLPEPLMLVAVGVAMNALSMYLRTPGLHRRPLSSSQPVAAPDGERPLAA